MNITVWHFYLYTKQRMTHSLIQFCLQLLSNVILSCEINCSRISRAINRSIYTGKKHSLTIEPNVVLRLLVVFYEAYYIFKKLGYIRISASAKCNNSFSLQLLNESCYSYLPTLFLSKFLHEVNVLDTKDCRQSIRLQKKNEFKLNYYKMNGSTYLQ